MQAKESAVYNGASSGADPTGLRNFSGITTTDLTTTAPTYADLLNALKRITDHNIDVSGAAWAINWTMATLLWQIRRFASGSATLLNEASFMAPGAGPMNAGMYGAAAGMMPGGKMAAVTNHLPVAATGITDMICGVWDYVWCIDYGTAFLTIDDISQANTGQRESRPTATTTWLFAGPTHSRSSATTPITIRSQANMATYNGRTGIAKNAPMSVDPTNNPDLQHVADVKTFLEGKSAVTVKAKEDIGLLGYAPGEDTTGEVRLVPVPRGGVARVIKQSDRDWNQPGMVLADYVARGRIEIVDDKAFDKAEAHKPINGRNRSAELARQAHLAQGVAGDHGTLVAGLMEQNRIMADRLDKLETKAA